MTAINFERQVMLADGTVQPFPASRPRPDHAIKQKGYQELKLDKRDDRAVGSSVRSGAARNGTRRSGRRSLDADKWDDTRGRKSLSLQDARRHLGDGAVPPQRLGADALRSAQARRRAAGDVSDRNSANTTRSSSGSRPIASKYVLPPGLPGFLMDTRLRGNWNTGHEWSFYPTLTDDMRYALIEFLKTYTTEPAEPRLAAEGRAPR